MEGGRRLYPPCYSSSVAKILGKCSTWNTRVNLQVNGISKSYCEGNTRLAAGGCRYVGRLLGNCAQFWCVRKNHGRHLGESMVGGTSCSGKWCAYRHKSLRRVMIPFEVAPSVSKLG